MLNRECSKACGGCEGVSVGFEVYEEHKTYLALIHVNGACVGADTDDGVFELGVDGVW